ncbi:hypothetical protein K7X08_026624 [Anisodus acutangulus]|uniref:Uncharacterized protein n=1 Tax=Anisodus acutangulus TaxID=402998 RepID=A0A9Q1QW37_9SOLA|nr:hypothetical protein K7X08_026624 [Anisodus acutangulus]
MEHRSITIHGEAVYYCWSQKMSEACGRAENTSHPNKKASHEDGSSNRGRMLPPRRGEIGRKIWEDIKGSLSTLKVKIQH